MKEKEKCTMKAEDSSYGPVADNRCPFSEDADTPLAERLR